MNIKAISHQFLYKLLNALFIIIALLSTRGLFFKAFADRQYYLLILISLLIGFSFFYFYVLQHSEIEFIKRGKATRILFGLLLLANVIVQLSNGAASFLFPLYYLVIFLVVFRYSVRIAYYSIIGIAVMEYGSIFFHKSISSQGILLLIKLIFLLLLVFIFDTMNSYLKTRRKKISNYPLKNPPATTLPQQADTIELLSSQHEDQSRLNIDQELFSTLTSILILIKNIFQPFTCAIFYYSPEKDESILYIYNSDSDNIVQNTHIRTGEGLIGLVAREKQPIIIGHLTRDSRTLRYYDSDEQIRSFIGIPFVMNNQLEGILTLDSKYEEAYTSDDQGALINFSQLVASFIHKARLMFELNRSNIKFTGLYEITKLLNSHLFQNEVISLLVEVVQKMFKFDRLALCMVDGNHRHFIIKQVIGQAGDLPEGATFSLSEKGRVEWVYRHRAICIITDLDRGDHPIPRYTVNENPQHGFKSFLAAPLMIEHQPIGVICLESTHLTEYTEREKEKISILMNIAEMALSKAHLYQRMENLATMDGLTGLANHRHFQNILSAELRRAKRHGLSIAILMVDIDYFKQINDNFGHQVGDYVLVEMAQVFRQTVREVDLVARYGGEEFTIILVSDKTVNAYLTAERLRTNVQKHKFHHQNQVLQVTISIGIALYPTDSENQSELIRLADKALYLAKENGRDCIKTCREL
jgi:diguanylate cyclase (GGDEF)-like protein